MVDTEQIRIDLAVTRSQLATVIEMLGEVRQDQKAAARRLDSLERWRYALIGAAGVLGPLVSLVLRFL